MFSVIDWIGVSKHHLWFWMFWPDTVTKMLLFFLYFILLQDGVFVLPL